MIPRNLDNVEPPVLVGRDGPQLAGMELQELMDSMPGSILLGIIVVSVGAQVMAQGLVHNFLGAVDLATWLCSTGLRLT